jgi:aspartate/methionine/tyrosine aminotransferase
MPRPPKSSQAVAAMGAAPFSPLAERARRSGLPVFPLHVGDTWMEPFEAARMEALRVADHPGLHRYCETAGIPPLVDRLVEKLRAHNGLAVGREGVLVTAGATSGLSCAVSALADPGEEVLILAPFWPLVRGIVRSQRAVPVEVPFYDRVNSAADAVAAVEERLSPRSVALYLSSPSNPTGRVLPRPWLEALGELARRHDLWLLSDEVYEDYVYRGTHHSVGAFAPERTLSVFSFSKAYGMAGCRAGYLAGPAAMVNEIHKVQIHSSYHAPHPAQLAALRALEGGAGWVEAARTSYRAAGEDAARTLGLPPPEGSMFLFVDVGPRLGEGGLDGLLEACLEAGVLVAPGSSSGAAYARWIRLCYSAVPPGDAALAVRRLARVLQAGPEGPATG